MSVSAFTPSPRTRSNIEVIRIYWVLSSISKEKLPLRTTLKHMGEWKYSASHSEPRH